MVFNSNSSLAKSVLKTN